MIGHHREHFGGSKILEARPAVVGVGATPLVVTLGENLTLDGLTQTARLVFRQRLEVVEPTQEEQVGQLLAMTSSGLEMPPVQKAFQIWSILLRSSPVSMAQIHQATAQRSRVRSFSFFPHPQPWSQISIVVGSRSLSRFLLGCVSCEPSLPLQNRRRRRRD